MKKTLLLLPMLLLALTGCKKEYFVERPNTNEPQWMIKDFEVRESHWLHADDNDGLNGHFFFSFNVPGMSQHIYNDGVIVAYLETEDYQQPLPVVRHNEAWDYEYDAQITWTRTIDYDFTSSAITFYVTNSDFFYERPETMRFRVVSLY